MRGAVVLFAAAALTACGGGSTIRSTTERLDRALAGTAQPSEVVSADIALARKVREDGPGVASRTATDDAIVHIASGPVPVAQVAGADAVGAGILEWDPKTVVMSCDGQMAVSQGRFRDSAGLVGTYVMVWEQQRDRTYRWAYRISGPDEMQPVPEPVPNDDAIVVTGIDAVKGLVAECPADRSSMPGPPAIAIAGDRQGGGLSTDQSLRWRWTQDSRTRQIAVDYFAEGRWQTVLDETFITSSSRTSR